MAAITDIWTIIQGKGRVTAIEGCHLKQHRLPAYPQQLTRQINLITIAYISFPKKLAIYGKLTFCEAMVPSSLFH